MLFERIKKLFHGEHKSFAWYVLAITSFFLLCWIVGPGNTFIHWISAGVEIKRQQQEILEYRHQIEQMDKRIDMLKHNRDTLEKFAREQYFFAAPGEDVYIYEE